MIEIHSFSRKVDDHVKSEVFGMAKAPTGSLRVRGTIFALLITCYYRTRRGVNDMHTSFIMDSYCNAVKV
uniref:Uncharacterized protein n=1 Tax=Oryza brachyantha TaxID=4533 RepID=J3LDD6_ORYBR